MAHPTPNQSTLPVFPLTQNLIRNNFQAKNHSFDSSKVVVGLKEGEKDESYFMGPDIEVIDEEFEEEVGNFASIKEEESWDDTTHATPHPLSALLFSLS